MPRLVLLCILCLGCVACKLQLQPSKNTLIRSESLWCLPSQTCNIQVSTTDFEATYVAEGIDDRFIFSHWQPGNKRLCGDSPSPCHLSTKGFENNQQLLDILASKQTFRLKPVTYEDINKNYPQAHPIQLRHDNYLLGEWTRDGDDAERDTWVFVATRDGEINLNLHDLKDNLDLAVLTPDLNAPLNQDADPEWSSRNAGIEEEDITITVMAGQAYFVQVLAGSSDVERSSYSLHLEVLKESSAIQPPGALARNYKLATSDQSAACSDGGQPTQPGLSSPDWEMANDGRRKNRANRILLEDGRVGVLDFAAVRYDKESGAYIDRAAYKVNDASGDTIHYLAAGHFSRGARFSGVEWSWFFAVSSKANCATASQITGS